MPFAVNGRFLGRPVTGVERYGREMLAALPGGVTIVQPGRGWVRWRGHVWEQLVLPRRLSPEAVLWSPANTGPLVAPRHIVTIHDLAVVEHPKWFRPSFAAWYGWLVPRLARRAKRVITDSDFTRRRLIALGIVDRKIVVVRPGVSPFFRPATQGERDRVRGKLGLGKRFLLFLGSLEPRKNLSALVQAWGRISPSFPDIELAIGGASGPSFGRVDLEGEPGAIRRLGYVPDKDLPGLYSSAEAFALVSHYEGFGLTALEAMACGAPLVLAHAGALPETAGEAARYVNPGNVAEIADGLAEVLADAGSRRRLRESGLARARAFRWDEAAAGVWDVMRAVGEGLERDG